MNASADTLRNIIEDIKYFIKDGVMTLPISIAATMLVIGLFTSHYAMLFFLVGYLFATPLLAFLLNNTIGHTSDIFKITPIGICNVSNPFESLTTPSPEGERSVFSEWLAMVCFFFGYIGMNGYQLYIKASNIPASTNKKTAAEINAKIATRKTQAMMSFGSIVVVFFAVLAYRLGSGCESFMAPSTSAWLAYIIITVGIALFGVGGASWYYLLSLVGEDRLSDVFGIANRLLDPGAFPGSYGQKPVACIPVV